LAYNVTYKKSVQKDLLNLGKAEAKRVLDKIEKELSDRANTYPTLKGSFAGLRKLRVGDYRVVFAITEQDVIILRVGHRREIYKDGG
jgi:addiction module RelE/StbE family toxin